MISRDSLILKPLFSKRWMRLVGIVTLAAGLLAGSAQAQTPVGTTFTYQGQLKKDGAPHNGACDFQFSLWDAASGGAQVGTTQTKSNVSVSNGLFTIPDLDFGAAAFTGAARWLQIAVRCPTGSGSYTTLSPRQALTAAPHALTLRPGAEIIGSVVGNGLFVHNTSTSGQSVGVWGQSPFTVGRGVFGYVTATSGDAVGVWGQSASTGGRGVVGWTTATSGVNTGVWGQSNSTDGRGMLGFAAATTGVNYGVWGESHSPNGIGVYGLHLANTGTAPGVYGRTNSTSNDAVGVLGEVSSTSPGEYSTAVRGMNKGTGITGIGVWGSHDGAGFGVYGTAGNGGYAVVGSGGGATGYAGYFLGHVSVTGNFSAGGTKSFKIDHPLDPANQYLYHAAVEAPEVQNIYNGVVTLDANGEAVVSLPAYFEAVNAGPYRYQLTPIGAPMSNLYIAQEVENNTFRIAGGVPGKKVSWLVIGIRNDPYMRDHPFQAEAEKSADEKGTYLYPEGYNQPAEKGLDYQRTHALSEQSEAEPTADSAQDR